MQVFALENQVLELETKCVNLNEEVNKLKQHKKTVMQKNTLVERHEITLAKAKMEYDIKNSDIVIDGESSGHNEIDP